MKLYGTLGGILNEMEMQVQMVKTNLHMYIPFIDRLTAPWIPYVSSSRPVQITIADL